MPRPSSPRVTPVPRDEWTESQRELLETSILPDANIFATFVRAPGLFRRWLPFGGKLLAGKISARDRELMILRTAWNCRSDYEWGQHVLIGRQAGLTDDEMTRVASHSPIESQGWSDADLTLLRATDELHEDWCISDRTWAALAERYDVEQMIEIPMLVGHYHLVAMTLNSLGVALDEELTGLPS